MLITLFAKSLRNMLLPGIMKLFLLCLLAYIVGWGIMSWICSALIGAYIGAHGAEGILLHLLGSAGGMMIAWFLFPLLYPILVNFFDDKMAEIIEREDYPQLVPARPPFWPTILSDLAFSLKAVALNIIVLPLYVIPPLALVLYYALNGYLLGTQFFRMAAGRRVAQDVAETLRKKARYQIIITGAAISFCSTIPFLNLAAPLLGVAIMLHLFHALNGSGKITILPPSA